jgi:hypothetical protein
MTPPPDVQAIRQRRLELSDFPLPWTFPGTIGDESEKNSYTRQTGRARSPQERSPFLMNTPSQALTLSPLLSDNDLANILVVTTDWVRSHAREIPGFKRLGSYFRFCSQTVEKWLGGLDRLFEANDVSQLLRVPPSWVYANADEIPGVLRLGRYLRFKPTVFQQFLTASEVVL